MSRINCHSAFKHYEMFHSRGGDVINIGSNNTTIFNMGAGFGGGSFWSGLGYGLGNGLGSIFGGLFGGNMGGFSNFGFGMSPWAGMGTFYYSMGAGGYGGSNRVDSHSDGKGKVKDSKDDKHDCDDPDLKKINGYRDDVQDIQDLEKPDKTKVKAKYDEIVKAKKDQDDTHKAENTAAYDDLLEDLQKIADENDWGKLDDNNFGIDDNKPADKANENKPADKANENKPDDKANENKPAAQAPVKKDNPIENADNVKFKEKLAQAGDDKGALKALALDKSLKPEQRAEAKAKFYKIYKNDYSNVTADELKDPSKAKALLKTLKTVIDTSDEYDFKDIEKVQVEQDKDGNWVITAESKFEKGTTAYLQYTYKGNVDGELIFHGKHENQHYVLQKDKQQVVHLMQYDYHSGHGTDDVNAEEQ